MKPFVLCAALLALAGTPFAARAQDHATTSARATPAEPARPRLPPPSVTHQVVELPGRTLRFTATAGSIILPDPQTGQPEAEIAVTSYQLEGGDPRSRPVTFALNGGPGFASAWLQLGAMGPWRLPMEGSARSPSAPPDAQPNPDTWLDFTDLVFIDPVGTGYSRFVNTAEDVRKRLWSVRGDAAALAQTIRRWLEANGRVVSPKFLAGESYGGFRAPRIARVLQSDLGIGLDGLVLVSPALDMAESGAFDPLDWAEHLPSIVAAARAAKGPVSRASLADVESYATGDYVTDMLRGDRDPAALDRIVAKVSALTGLDPALVRREHGQINRATFLREVAPGRIGSPYDPTATVADPYPADPYAHEPDPVLDALSAPFSSAMTDIYAHRLNWHPDGLYRLFNEQAAHGWDWQRGFDAPESVNALRTDLAADPHMRVLVAHGLFDQVTPYLRTQLLINNIPPEAGGDRIKLVAFEGGHMFYSRDASRTGLRQEAAALIAPPQ
jgi:carboxypeptidase C (cathepsin A)